MAVDNYSHLPIYCQFWQLTFIRIAPSPKGLASQHGLIIRTVLIYKDWNLSKLSDLVYPAICHDPSYLPRPQLFATTKGNEPMFIQTEATPNPATLKFLPGQTVVEEGSFDFRSAEDAADSPLALRLFNLADVSGVFLGYDFVTITKNSNANGPDWQHLKPAILGAIMEHFMSGDPVMVGELKITGDLADEFFEAEDAKTVELIKELLETRVRPAVAQDGGDIAFRGFKEGVVYLHMRGACAGCPSSTATLKHGIQNLLRHFIPDVEEVEAI